MLNLSAVAVSVLTDLRKGTQYYGRGTQCYDVAMALQTLGTVTVRHSASGTAEVTLVYTTPVPAIAVGGRVTPRADLTRQVPG